MLPGADQAWSQRRASGLVWLLLPAVVPMTGTLYGEGGQQPSLHCDNEVPVSSAWGGGGHHVTVAREQLPVSRLHLGVPHTAPALPMPAAPVSPGEGSGSPWHRQVGNRGSYPSASESLGLVEMSLEPVEGAGGTCLFKASGWVGAGVHTLQSQQRLPLR